MKPVNFHKDVEAEITTAIDWYDAQSEGLGERFLAELNRAVVSIQKNPAAWPEVSFQIRRYVFANFPFSLVYSELGDSLLVLAVMHNRRKPGYWQYRQQ